MRGYAKTQQAFMEATRSVVTSLQHLNKIADPGIEVHGEWLWIDQCLICEGIRIDWSRRILGYLEGPESERCVDEQRAGKQSMSIRPEECINTHLSAKYCPTQILKSL